MQHSHALNSFDKTHLRQLLGDGHKLDGFNDPYCAGKHETKPAPLKKKQTNRSDGSGVFTVGSNQTSGLLLKRRHETHDVAVENWLCSWKADIRFADLSYTGFQHWKRVEGLA